MSDSEEPIDIPDEGGDDLFGDEGDDMISEIGDIASDRELGSDREDDEANARRRDDENGGRVFRDRLVTEVPLYRHRIPRSKDGSVSCNC